MPFWNQRGLGHLHNHQRLDESEDDPLPGHYRHSQSVDNLTGQDRNVGPIH